MTWNWQQIVEDNKDNVKSFDLIPDGKYTVKVESAEAKKSSNDNPMIEMRLRITEGQFASRVLFFRSTATEKSQGIFLRNLAAFGLTSEWLVANNPSFDVIANALVERTAVAVVGHGTGQYSERNEVKGINPAPQSAAPAQGAPQATAPTSPFGAAPAAPAAADPQAGPWGAPAAPEAPQNPFGSAPKSPF